MLYLQYAAKLVMYKTCNPVMYQLRVCTAGVSLVLELSSFILSEGLFLSLNWYVHKYLLSLVADYNAKNCSSSYSYFMHPTKSIPMFPNRVKLHAFLKF